MIELRMDTLNFSFPEVHPQAKVTVEFQRTLRIPDDGSDYPLPPGLGRFPLSHVDDHADKVPQHWLERGGVMLPMYQSEAMWLNFSGHYDEERGVQYPFVLKVAAGKINAVTGDQWTDGIHCEPQDYVVIPEQPWLDGYCVEKGVIRQFVAMPLGSGYSAEEQITGKGEVGGVQVIAYPMKREVYERRFPKRPKSEEITFGGPPPGAAAMPSAMSAMELCGSAAPEMGLGAGGRMRQEIHDDPYTLTDWDRDNSSRCFVHLGNSLIWRQITGAEPPTTPPTAQEYNNSGLPWFEHYSDKPAVEGSPTLAKVKSIATLGKEKGDVPLPENQSCVPDKVVALRAGLAKNEVRDGRF